MIFFDPSFLDTVPPPPPPWLTSPYWAVIMTFSYLNGDTSIRTCIIGLN